MTNYEKYQLEWMIEHEQSLADLISGLSKIEENNPGITLKKIYERWESKIGFGGTIWMNEDEWEVCEGNDKNNADDPVIAK